MKGNKRRRAFNSNFYDMLKNNSLTPKTESVKIEPIKTELEKREPIVSWEEQIDPIRKEKLDTLDTMNLTLLEMENWIVDFILNYPETSIRADVIPEIANRIVALRDLMNTAWAKEVIQDRRRLPNQGESVEIIDDTLVFRFPYTFVTKNTTFKLYLRYLKTSKDLYSIRVAWDYLMMALIDSIEQLPFKTPLSKGKVHVVVAFPTHNRRDADHFWLRPVLDTLVYSRVLMNDYTENINLYFSYFVDKENPRLEVRVSPDTK